MNMGLVKPLLIGAGLLLALPAMAGPKEQAEARAAFRRGSKLFAGKDYVGALEAFQSADFVQPHFLLKCNMARCYERMGKMVEAAEQYRACLRGGAARKRRVRRKVARALRKVRTKITWVEVTSPGKGGTVHVNGLERGPAPVKVGLNPGTSVVEVRRPGATPAGGTITTAGGESQVLELVPKEIVGARPSPAVSPIVAPAPAPRPRPVPTPQPADPPRRGLSQVWFWCTAALTVGLAVAASMLGLQALQMKADYEDNPTREGYSGTRDRRLLTNIFWGLTIAAGASATTLFFFTDFSLGSSRPKPRVDDDEEVAIGIGLRGTF